MSEETGSDVALEVGGQKLNVTNVKSLNTMATIATLMICGFVLYFIWEHKIDDRQFKEQVVSAIKAQAESNRVLACLMATPQNEREAKLAQCERIAR